MGRSRDACVLSCLKLAAIAGATESYLHTFTFAEPEPSQREAVRRWKSIRTRLVQLGRRGVWALQRGALRKRLHFHVITVERWEWAEMWEMLPKYGFGRYNCQPPRAIQFAAYVARYVGNSPGLEPGSRTWGVFGFKGVSSANVVRDEIVIDSVAELPRWFVSQLWRVSLRDSKFARRKSYSVKMFHRPLLLTKQMNEIKPHMHAEILKDAQAGLYAICVGEYRGFSVVAGKKMDKISEVEKSTVRVEHTVLCGSEQVRFTEFLSSGADAAAIKPAAESGEMVLCRVTEWRRNQMTGAISARGHIKPLLPLALTPAPATRKA